MGLCSKSRFWVRIGGGCFNTSYVSVQEMGDTDAYLQVKGFQYILCFGSSQVHQCQLPFCHFVSIHPMFRFKSQMMDYMVKEMSVSIHPMFRFKVLCLAMYYKYKGMFQYILCFGSSLIPTIRKPNSEICFNTSYVSVQVVDTYSGKL